MSDDLHEQDCAVCLQKCHHPTQLPCGHIFCFLCVKGVAILNRKCAMCRAEIPLDYLNHPILLDNAPVNSDNTSVEYQWYYEGRNGWWKYDERSNIELESAFNNNVGECKLLLAGALYCIDFGNMTQVKCNDRTRRRHVRRDTPLFPAKGIAGIKSDSTQPTKTEDDSSNIHRESEDIEVVDDDSDADVQIVSVEPVIIQIDDVSEEFDRLSIINSQDPESSSGDA